MATYLYCVLTRGADADLPAPSLRGLEGQPIRILSAGVVEAWVSTISTVTPTGTVDAVKAHDRVVGAALATGRTPLPARFGQTWASDGECAVAIEARADELDALLRRVAGLVEMTVCTFLPGMPPAVPAQPAAASELTPGRAYLDTVRARVRREQHLRLALEALRDRVSGALRPLSRAEVAEIRGTDRALALSVSYLVERGVEARFREAVADVARDAAARLVVAGPRAPYSFAPTPRRPGRPYSESSARQSE